MSALPATDRQVALSADAAACLDLVRSAWRTHRPTSASLCEPDPVPGAEDLTTDGLDRWSACLDGLLDTVRARRRRAARPLDRIALDEAARFVRAELHQQRAVRPYEHSVDAYLSLVLATLAPLLGGDREGHDQVAGERLDAVPGWLDAARGRLRCGAARPSPGSAPLAARIADALPGADLQALRPERPALRRAVAGLRALAEDCAGGGAASGDRPRRAAGPGPAETLADGLGVPGDVRWWSRQVGRRLDRGLRRIDRLERDGHRLQDLDRREPLPGNGLPHLAEPARLQRTPRAWFEAVARAMAGPAAEWLGAPPAADPVGAEPAAGLSALLVDEALYLRAGRAPAPGRLLLAPRLLRGDRPMTRRHALYLALIAAHEGVPGHHEHATRAEAGPLGRFAPMLRSPAAFEGWAVQAEAVAAGLGDLAELACAYRDVRRLLSAAVVLARAARGPAAAGELLDRAVGTCPALRPHARRGELLMPGALPYAVGAVQVERAIAELAGAAVPAPRAALADVGPICLPAAARLARRRAQTAAVGGGPT